MEERRKDEFSERITRLEEQMKRLLSHLESEKGTQQRIAADIKEKFTMSDERLNKVERTIWTATGALAVVVLLINLLEMFFGRMR